MTVETQKKGITPTRRAWRKNNPTLQLRVERQLREAMKQRARTEGMKLAGWVRHVCAKELRRKSSL
jgi:predicted DNA binding CopG/RHH family protein